MANTVETPAHYLPKGTLLNNKYEILSALGSGGFGITYKGHDKLLDIPVAIKEYYPNGYANRYAPAGLNVAISESRTSRCFVEWKDKFLNEARTLAKFSNIPGIVTVRDYFEENDTAYIVMEYLDGVNLKQYVQENGPFPAEEICEKMIPLMDSLKKIHSYNLIHRDISPENIMIMPDGKLKLYDFGAARDFAKQSGKSMSILLKPGYAPEEQYRTRGKQGPYTDVYALCATLYFCITRVVPDESVERVFHDELRQPSELGVAISPIIEKAIMKGMSIRTEDRYQDIKSLSDALSGNVSSDNNVVINNNFGDFKGEGRFADSVPENYTKTGIVSGDMDIVAASEGKLAESQKSGKFNNSVETSELSDSIEDNKTVTLNRGHVKEEDNETVVMPKEQSVQEVSTEDRLTVTIPKPDRSEENTQSKDTLYLPKKSSEAKEESETVQNEKKQTTEKTEEEPPKKKFNVLVPIICSAACILLFAGVFFGSRMFNGSISVEEQSSSTTPAVVDVDATTSGSTSSAKETTSDVPVTEIAALTSKTTTMSETTTAASEITTTTAVVTETTTVSTESVTSAVTSAPQTTTTASPQTTKPVTTPQTTTVKTTKATTKKTTKTTPKTTTTAKTTKKTTKKKTTTTKAEPVVSAESDMAKYFDYERYGDGIVLTSYSGSVTELIIPSVIDGKKVVALGNDLFCENRTIKKVIIPEGVTTLESAVFLYAQNLREVQLPNSLEKICGNAFYGCSALEKLYIPANVSSIEMLCFGWSGLKEIEVDKNNPFYYSDDGVLFCSIDKSLVFYPIYKADSTYTIPDGVKKVQSYGFDRPLYLEKVVIPKGFERFEGEALFSYVKEFEVMPDNELFAIKDGVLYSKDMSYLYFYPPRKTDKSFTIPDEVKVISDYAFHECMFLIEVSFSGSLAYIREESFWGTNIVLFTYEEQKFNTFTDFYNYFISH